MTANTLNHILIIILILTYSCCLKTATSLTPIEQNDSDLNYNEFAQKHLEMMSFSNKLKKTHVNLFT